MTDPTRRTGRAWLSALLVLVLACTAWANTPPNVVAAIFNTTTTAAATDILPTDLAPAALQGGVGTIPTSVAYRVTIALVTTSSVVDVQINSGGTARLFALNSGTALTAGQLYTFEFAAARQVATDGVTLGNAITYNFQVATLSTVGYLVVEEIYDGGL